MGNKRIMKKIKEKKILLSTCEEAKAIFLQKQEAAKQATIKEKQDFVNMVLTYFNKIFKDIKYNQEKDQFELCGYNFYYGYYEPRRYKREPQDYLIKYKYNSDSVLCLKYINGDRGLINSLEDLGYFLIEEEKIIKEERVKAVQKPTKKSFWQRLLTLIKKL